MRHIKTMKTASRKEFTKCHYSARTDLGSFRRISLFTRSFHGMRYVALDLDPFWVCLLLPTQACLSEIPPDEAHTMNVDKQTAKTSRCLHSWGVSPGCVMLGLSLKLQLVNNQAADSKLDLRMWSMLTKLIKLTAAAALELLHAKCPSLN